MEKDIPLDTPQEFKICIPLKGCSSSVDKRWEVVDRVGDPSGVGEIWLACCDAECSYVLKYQRFGKTVSSKGEYAASITNDDFLREVSIQRSMSKIGLAPPVIDEWECTGTTTSTSGTGVDGGVMIMPALNETVFSLLQRYKDSNIRMQILRECIDLIIKMHAAGYYHGDLHLKNIMVSIQPGSLRRSEYGSHTYRYFLIDFGLSGKLTLGSDKVEKDFDTLLTRAQEAIPLSKKEEKELRRYIKERTEDKTDK